MPKISRFALLAVFALSATSPALGDGNWAAEFALKTCLPAMDDLAAVEAIARENNWVRHPPTPTINPSINPKLAEALKSQIRWSATLSGKILSVVTGINENGGIIPYCEIGINNIYAHNNISRDEFVATISASLELKLVSEETYTRLRIEYYDVTTGAYEKVRISIKSSLDGRMAWIDFYKVVSPA